MGDNIKLRPREYYFVIELKNPKDIQPVVSLITSSLNCDCRVYQYRGELMICFVCTPDGPMADVLKHARRLGRGKRRFRVAGHNPQVGTSQADRSWLGDDRQP